MLSRFRHDGDNIRMLRRLLYVSVVLLLLIVAGIGLIFELINRQQIAQTKDRSEQISRGLQTNVEMFFHEHIHALTFVSAVYRDGLVQSQKDFSYYGSQAFNVVPGFHSLSASNPDYQLIFQYPAVNRLHDLRKYPDRLIFAEKAKRTHTITTTDPVRLVSGLFGFGVYVPVFDGEHFKGLVVGTFDINKLVEKQLKPVFQGIPFTLSLENGTEFYRTADIPNNSPPNVDIPLHLSDKTWIVHCWRPPASTNGFAYDRALGLVTVLLTAALCLVLLYMLQMNRMGVQQSLLQRFESDYSSVMQQFDVKLQENSNLYRQLENAQGELVRAMRMATLGHLSTVIAHEIRNPLTALIGCIEALKRSLHCTGEEEELITVSMKEALRLNNIVSDLLNFAGPRVISTQKVGLADLLDRVRWSFLRDNRWSGNVRISRNCPGPCPIAEVDPDLIQEVLWNLIINAAQAGDVGGEIDLSCAAVDGQAQIVVRDFGKGIPSDVRSRIFEPFFSTKASGVGLGLSIVKRIVEDHGGKVSIESQEGRGTLVKVWVPLAEAENANVAIADC